MCANKEKHVVVGTGPLGLAVMRELLIREKEVIMVNQKSFIELPKDVILIHANVSNFEESANAFKGATVVYHCAKPDYTKWPEQFPNLNKGIIYGTSQAGAKLIYADNLFMYGSSKQPYNESSLNLASDRKGLVRAQMAEEILEAHYSGTIRAAIGRGPDFYGPNVLHSILGERVFKSALQGKAAKVIGCIDVPHTHIYINDFARGLVTLAENEESLGEIWHIPSDTTVTTKDLIQLVYKEIQKTFKVQCAPKQIFRLMALFNPYMREMKEIYYVYNQPYIVDHSKYERTFGLEVTPHAKAIKETLDWYRNNLY